MKYMFSAVSACDTPFIPRRPQTGFDHPRGRARKRTLPQTDEAFTVAAANNKAENNHIKRDALFERLSLRVRSGYSAGAIRVRPSKL